MPKSRTRAGARIRSVDVGSLGAGDRKFDQRLSALESQIYELVKGLEEFIDETNRDFDALLDQQAECNLRIMFLMQQKLRREIASPIVGAPPQVVTMTMYDLYMEQRDAFQASLKARVQHEREQATDAPAAPPSNGGGAIELTDASADVRPPLVARGPKLAQ